MKINLDEKYKKHFSEESFFKKIAKYSIKAGLNVIYAALLLYYVLVDNDTPIKYKGIIIMALGYFILPTDLIPDLIPALGFTDDLAALAVAFKVVQTAITPEQREKARANIRQWFGNVSDEDLDFVENQLRDK